MWQCACFISVWEAVHDMCFVHRQFVDERWSLWLLFVFHLQLLKVSIVVKRKICLGRCAWYMFFVYGHLVNERCDAHACLAGVSTARGLLGLVLCERC